LVDSLPGVVESFQKMVNQLSSKQVKDEEIANLIGRPLAEIVGLLLETNDSEIISKGSESFKDNYQRNGLFNNYIYPGVKEMLENLKNESYQIFIVSNKIELFMKKILSQHKIENYFIDVRGTDGSDVKSRKADYLKSILNDHNLEKEKSVIIGDTVSDISAGKENNIYSIGVTWGYGTKESLINANANKIINKPIELKQFLNK